MTDAVTITDERRDRRRIDSDRLTRWIDELAAFSEAPAPAVTRVLFSDVDLAARAWVIARCEEEGLVIRQDAVGNIFARWRRHA